MDSWIDSSTDVGTDDMMSESDAARKLGLNQPRTETLLYSA
jgi:hypothetical protein